MVAIPHAKGIIGKSTILPSGCNAALLFADAKNANKRAKSDLALSVHFSFIIDSTCTPKRFVNFNLAR